MGDHPWHGPISSRWLAEPCEPGVGECAGEAVLGQPLCDVAPARRGWSERCRLPSAGDEAEAPLLVKNERGPEFVLNVRPLAPRSGTPVRYQVGHVGVAFTHHAVRRAEERGIDLEQAARTAYLAPPRWVEKTLAQLIDDELVVVAQLLPGWGWRVVTVFKLGAHVSERT